MVSLAQVATYCAVGAFSAYTGWNGAKAAGKGCAIAHKHFTESFAATREDLKKLAQAKVAEQQVKAEVNNKAAKTA